jgi:hypothetical protein
MNKQMKSKLHELADQCKHPDNYHQGPWMDYIQFAELVVQQCIDNLQVPKAELKDLSEYNKGWVSGRLLAIENIKKDFGIADA